MISQLLAFTAGATVATTISLATFNFVEIHDLHEADINGWARGYEIATSLNTTGIRGREPVVKGRIECWGWNKGKVNNVEFFGVTWEEVRAQLCKDNRS